MSGRPAWKTPRSTWTRTAGQQAVRDRSPDWCELRIPGVCLAYGMSFSHRKPASLGGGYDPSNGNRACGSGTTGCHGHVEHHPDDAEQLGWRVPYGDPAQVPAFIWTDLGQGWVLLTDTNPGLYVSEGAIEAALHHGLPEHPTLPERSYT